MKEILLIAHRGASAYAPENSVESFKKAIAMNAKAIECDVRISKDKKLVVIHDDKIDRTTKMKGFVKDYDASQLKEFGIPEFEDFLKLMKENSVILLVEIKEPGSEKKALSLVKDYRLESRVIIVSFFAEVIEKVKKLDSMIRTGYIFSRIESKSPIEVALSAKADLILPRYSLVDKDMTHEAHENQLKVFTWTVDSKETAEEMIKLGVDGIASNKPDLLY
jgi:glycerophosphoryl diester phosphodiesterase